MDLKQDILESVKGKNIDAIIQRLLSCSSRPKEFNLSEVFEIFNKQQSTAFWNLIYKHFKELLPLVCGEGATDHCEMQENLVTVKAILSCIDIFCQASSFKPPSLFDIVVLSQNILTSLSCSFSLSTSIKSIILKICEYWWINNEEGAELLIPQMITFLLLTSLDIHGHDTDIKRLFGLRGGFLLLDFEDVSFAFIKDLILRCFVHPAFLKLTEGQRFLSFLLNVNQGCLIETVSVVIRPQLLTAAKAVTTAYGDILHRAWKEALLLNDDIDSNGKHSRSNNKVSIAPVTTSNSAAQILEDTIQSFLKEGIHACEEKYFRGIRCLLKAFHDVRRGNEVDAMLLRIYDPILWRSLRCANPLVRAQAAVMFLDVFPLHAAEVAGVSKAEEDDRLMQKQFDMLATLLRDVDQRVRAHAALGVCHILQEYWDMLPINTTHTILKYLIDTLSVDASCANVRHAVFVGIEQLLFHQPLVHNLLKQLLPLLQNAIHDKAEKVRIAFIKILCQVKTIRGMHYYEIVPVDHLLEQLAADRNRPAVCLVMTELLLNSFYPQQQQKQKQSRNSNNNQQLPIESIQLDRCVQFIDRSPLAAEAFYTYLPHFLPIGYTAKFITMLFTYLLTSSAVQQKQQQQQRQGLQQSSNITNDEQQKQQASVRVKRRRSAATELSTAAGDETSDDIVSDGDNNNSSQSANIDDLPSPLMVPFAIQLGILRILVCMLEHTASELKLQHPARKLILKYLSMTNTHRLIVNYSHINSNHHHHHNSSNDGGCGHKVVVMESAHLLTVSLRLAAITASMRTWNDDDDDANESGKTNAATTATLPRAAAAVDDDKNMWNSQLILVSTYASAWQNNSNNNTISSTAAVSSSSSPFNSKHMNGKSISNRLESAAAGGSSTIAAKGGNVSSNNNDDNIDNNNDRFRNDLAASIVAMFRAMNKEYDILQCVAQSIQSSSMKRKNMQRIATDGSSGSSKKSKKKNNFPLAIPLGPAMDLLVALGCNHNNNNNNSNASNLLLPEKNIAADPLSSKFSSLSTTSNEKQLHEPSMGNKSIFDILSEIRSLYAVIVMNNNTTSSSSNNNTTSSSSNNNTTSSYSNNIKMSLKQRNQKAGKDCNTEERNTVVNVDDYDTTMLRYLSKGILIWVTYSVKRFAQKKISLQLLRMPTKPNNPLKGNNDTDTTTEDETTALYELKAAHVDLLEVIDWCERCVVLPLLSSSQLQQQQDLEMKQQLTRNIITAVLIRLLGSVLVVLSDLLYLGLEYIDDHDENKGNGEQKSDSNSDQRVEHLQQQRDNRILSVWLTKWIQLLSPFLTTLSNNDATNRNHTNSQQLLLLPIIERIMLLLNSSTTAVVTPTLRT